MKNASRRTLVLVILLAINIAGFSQQQKIDSLQRLIAAPSKSGLDKYDPTVALMRLYFNMDSMSRSLNYARQLNELAYRYGDTVKIVESSRMVALLLEKLSRIEEADLIINDVLPISRRHAQCRKEYIRLLIILGVIYARQAKYDKALEVHHATLKLVEEDKDHEKNSIVLQNIGFVYYRLLDHEKAPDYYMRSLRLKRSIKFDLDVEHLMVNIAICYARMDHFPLATTYVDSAQALCRVKNCDNILKVNAYYCLGLIQRQMKKFDQAEF